MVAATVIIPAALAPEPKPGKISAAALTSLVCSIGLGIGSVPAIVLGHVAKAHIRRDPTLCGKGLATLGLVLGYLSLVLAVTFLATGFVVLNPKHGRQITAKEEAVITPTTLAARLVDEVKVGDPTSEFEHNMIGAFSSRGTYQNTPVRDAVNGGFVRYTMKVDPVHPMILRCKYWGNDNGSRRFDVIVNDKIIATQRLEFNDPGRFFYEEYDIPADLTRGKSEVTVVFQAYPGQKAGGFYGCQMLKR